MSFNVGAAKALLFFPYFFQQRTILTKTNYKKLNPSYVSGFIEGQGSRFTAGISADSTCKSGYRLKFSNWFTKER